ncbi:SMP-30/gluconolactonase/LRE family protein [Jiella sp. M17.18]|uniref:SMP-30/gluconolactonase/LRE family protein n=1 Tax=Jiella sp. M17.18 TaxID=3234247 RepID=UPI0034DE2EFC
MTATEPELVLDLRCELGESPVWLPAEQVLVFVDIKRRRLHRFDPVSERHDGFGLPEEIGCVAPAKEGGFVAGLRSGIWQLDDAGQPAAMLAENPEDAKTHRFNDGCIDPAGRFWLGTLDETKQAGDAHLYRFDRRGLTRVEGGLMTSNGAAFSPDGRFMYHSDTPRRTIYRYDYDAATGTASNRQIFAKWEIAGDDLGRPDGGAVDAEGCYWSALYEGGRIRRYSPQGEILAEYQVPAKCPTMIAFGGRDLRTLFITTARSGRPADELSEFPHSGGLFAMQVETPGLPKPPFDPES